MNLIIFEVLVSDAISRTRLSDGGYELGGLGIFVKDGVSTLHFGVLVGSTLILDRAVKNMVGLTNVPISDAVMATHDSRNDAECVYLQRADEFECKRVEHG